MMKANISKQHNNKERFASFSFFTRNHTIFYDFACNIYSTFLFYINNNYILFFIIFLSRFGTKLIKMPAVTFLRQNSK